MINKLTPEQEAYLPVFRQEYFDKALNPERIDPQKMRDAIDAAYLEIGEKPPSQIIIAESPKQAMLIVTALETLENEEHQGTIREQLADKDWEGLEHTLKKSLKISCFNSNFLWGSQDFYWIAWGRFGQHIGVELDEDTKRKIDIMENISLLCEWWWPYKEVCVVSEKPLETHWDNGVLHGEDKPSVVYSDGFSLYSWRGTEVPEEWIMNPKESLTSDMAITWENVEQRRCVAEILGWANILKDPRLKAKVIDEDVEPQIGTLLEVNIPDIGLERFLKVECGTGRDFALPVPPETKTALEAQAWLNFCTPEDILDLEVRT